MDRQVKISTACEMMLNANARGCITDQAKPDGDGFVIKVSEEIFDRFLAERVSREDFSNWFARISVGSTELKRPPAALRVNLMDMDEDEKQSALVCDHCGGPLPEKYFDVRDECLPNPCPPLWQGEVWMACSQGCVDDLMAKYNGK